VGAGDCDSDADCKSGLKCGTDNCGKCEEGQTCGEWQWNDDCCYQPEWFLTFHNDNLLILEVD
jgi:hypothetical protein